jgi:hypothetical protein
VYRLTREEAEHVLDPFPVVCKYDERDYGEYRTKRLVLEAYDRMAAAPPTGVKAGGPWLTCGGSGPRHKGTCTADTSDSTTVCYRPSMTQATTS